MSDTGLSRINNRPIVSVLVVARNSDQFIHDALLSVRQQTFEDIEIVVVNDGSTDSTGAIAEHHARQDARVRVLAGPGGGLAEARNASLDAARGHWAAILDSDDLFHPRHLQWLLADAGRSNSALTAANMVTFRSDPRARKPALFVERSGWGQERNIGLAEFIRQNGGIADSLSLGYLKPLFDLAFLRSHRLRYNSSLRIGEDYDLVVRALAAGGQFRYLPRPSYFYRRHASSLSYRMERSDLVALIAAGEADGSELRAGDREGYRPASRRPRRGAGWARCRRSPQGAAVRCGDGAPCRAPGPRAGALQKRP